MHDFCTVSLGDPITPWPVIEQRLRAAASGDFVVALYNPRSKSRDGNWPRRGTYCSNTAVAKRQCSWRGRWAAAMNRSS